MLGRQCLARRIDDGRRLADEVAAWESDRNLRATQVNWQFTTDDAESNCAASTPSSSARMNTAIQPSRQRSMISKL